MKLTTDLNLLRIPVLDNNIFIYFYVTSMDYEITESINICHFSDRFTTRIKVNIKEIFMRIDVFLKMFIWWMECSLRIKYLVFDKI